MSILAGIIQYEYRMSIARAGLLLVFAVFIVFYGFLTLSSAQIPQDPTMGQSELSPDEIQAALLQEAGQLAFSLNLFFPVIAGIIVADRAVRDRRLGVRELLRVTRMNTLQYVLGKYLGVALSILTLQFGIILLVSLLYVIAQLAPPVFVAYSLLASLGVNLPGLLFITAFSIACPLVMPVRVYQILFTGYWYWGNFLNPAFIPTIADTLLNASGKFVLTAFYGQTFFVIRATPTEAVLNILVLLGCATVALTGMVLYYTYREA